MSHWIGKVVLSIFLVSVCVTLFQSYLILNLDTNKLSPAGKDRVSTLRRWILLFMFCLFILVSASMLETRWILLYGVRMVGFVMFALRFIVFSVSISISAQIVFYGEEIQNYTTLRNLAYASLACSGAWLLVVVYKRYRDYNEGHQNYLLAFDKEWNKSQPFKISTKKLSCSETLSHICPTDATFVLVQSLAESSNEELKPYSDYIVLQTNEEQYSDYNTVFKNVLGTMDIDKANNQITLDVNRDQYEFGSTIFFESFPHFKPTNNGYPLLMLINTREEWMELEKIYPELSKIEREIIDHYLPEGHFPENHFPSEWFSKDNIYPYRPMLGTILIDHQLYQLGIRDWNVNHRIKVLAQQGSLLYFLIGAWRLFPWDVFGSEFQFGGYPNSLGFYIYSDGMIEQSFPDYTQPLVKRRQSHKVYLTSSGDIIVEHHMYFGMGCNITEIPHSTVQGYNADQIGGLASIEFVMMFNVTKQKVYYLYKNYAWANQTIQRFMELVSRQAYTDRQVDIKTLCDCINLLLTTRVINETDYELIENDCSIKETLYRVADFCHPDEERQSELGYILGLIIYSLPTAKQTKLIEKITPILYKYDLTKLQAWKTNVLPKLVK